MGDIAETDGHYDSQTTVGLFRGRYQGPNLIGAELKE